VEHTNEVSSREEEREEAGRERREEEPFYIHGVGSVNETTATAPTARLRSSWCGE